MHWAKEAKLLSDFAYFPNAFTFFFLNKKIKTIDTMQISIVTLQELIVFCAAQNYNISL